jgi:hypothetical protein
VKTYDNSGKLIGEINTIIIPNEAVVETNTIYSADRVVSQTITRREFKGGAVRVFEVVYGGKLLP